MTAEPDESRKAVADFAAARQLPPRWEELKEGMRSLVERPDFWYRPELRDRARVLAVEASEILDSTLHPDRHRPLPPAAMQSAKHGEGAPAGEEERWMRRAIALAAIAKSRGDTPVGSLVVRDGEIVGEGIEAVKKKLDVSAHSELIAIREASGRLGSLDLSGCTLVTTAEPCFLCSYAVRQTRIARVVIGHPVAGVGGASSRHAILVDTAIPGWGPPPEVVFGVLESECRALKDSVT